MSWTGSSTDVRLVADLLNLDDEAYENILRQHRALLSVALVGAAIYALLLWFGIF